MSDLLLQKILPALLMLVAIALAWWLGRRSVPRSGGRGTDFARDYFVGLNYLVNDEPDDAIDIFIRSLEVNSDSLEAHLALGALLRRRGKVDKSITVYQGLLARPRLSERQTNEIKVELARSYISAGLLDRAERLLEQLQSANDEFRQTALCLSLNVYQMERDWERGIAVAEDLVSSCPGRERPQYQKIASHFYCELAEQEIAGRHYRNARQLLKKAQQMSRSNVRVSFLAGQVEMELENYRDAIKHLSRVSQQDPDFYPEVFASLLDCYRRLKSEKQLERFIQGSLEETPAASILLNVSEHIELQQGSSEALHFLLGHIREKPSLVLINKALKILGEEADEGQRNLHMLFHHVIDDYLSQAALYRCTNCGFEGKSLHWSCPGCSSWNSVRPVKGIAGE